MGYRALSDVLLGTAAPAHAGELLPATFRDSNGDEQPVDFERLVGLGVAEEVPVEKPARKSAAKD